MASVPTIRVGVSGWRYSPWRGNFYPKGLSQRAELEYASRTFPSLEINGSFYSLQSPASWQAWYDAAPERFRFAVKGPRYITHMLRLQNVETPLANFFASGIFNLREKLGPSLWQLPPNFAFDADRLSTFLELLRPDLAAAAKLARKREGFMRGRTVLRIGTNRPLRHALEIRHESFDEPRFLRLLRKHRIALVVADTAGRWPMLQDVTADFMYLRLHGDKELYRSGYRPAAIERWANRITAWAAGDEPSDAPTAGARKKRRGRPRDVYCYFDNTDAKLRAPIDAKSLMRRLGLRWPDPSES